MKTSRRIFLAGAGATAASALSGSAFAQSAIDDI
ncbi:MAG: twin-arginine translocation signal domain-containing protein, partial [Neoaquamicrobium sediminum]